MMKYVIALVLLHFCNSFALNRDLNNEIIIGLVELSKLYKDKEANITSPETVHAPAFSPRNASSCVHILVRGLKHLLNNVSVHEDKRDIIDGLKKNLDRMDLSPNKTNLAICRMRTERLKPFHLYASHFRQLNKNI